MNSRQDSLGELTALPRLRSWIKWKGKDVGEGKEVKEKRGRRGEKGKGGERA